MNILRPRPAEAEDIRRDRSCLGEGTKRCNPSRGRNGLVDEALLIKRHLQLGRQTNDRRQPLFFDESHGSSQTLLTDRKTAGPFRVSCRNRLCTSTLIRPRCERMTVGASCLVLHFVATDKRSPRPCYLLLCICFGWKVMPR